MSQEKDPQTCQKCGSPEVGGACPSCEAEGPPDASLGLLMPTEDGQRGKLTTAQVVIISVRALLGAGVGAVVAVFGLMVYGLAIHLTSIPGLIFNTPYGIPALVIGICLGYFVRWRWLRDSTV